MDFLQLKLFKCQNASSSPSGVGVQPNVTCKNQTYIDAYFANETFDFAFVNIMFALNNYV